MNIRIVQQNGRYKLHQVGLDPDTGEVEKVFDELSIVATSFGEFRQLLEDISQARKHHVVVVNACNRGILMGAVDG